MYVSPREFASCDICRKMQITHYKESELFLQSLCAIIVNYILFKQATWLTPVYFRLSLRMLNISKLTLYSCTLCRVNVQANYDWLPRTFRAWTTEFVISGVVELEKINGSTGTKVPEQNQKPSSFKFKRFFFGLAFGDFYLAFVKTVSNQYHWQLLNSSSVCLKTWARDWQKDKSNYKQIRKATGRKLVSWMASEVSRQSCKTGLIQSALTHSRAEITKARSGRTRENRPLTVGEANSSAFCALSGNDQRVWSSAN